jgi:hypothetical protein
MSFKLVRTETSDKGTFGKLFVDSRVMFYTCELPWNDNQRKVSCIPVGTYKAKLRNSPKYNDHWHLQDVPNRSMILIHHGNTIKDIEGCILVGLGRGEVDGLPAVTSSRRAMELMRQVFPREFMLTIEENFN